jgi:SAM-dependent methyltransferase
MVDEARPAAEFDQSYFDANYRNYAAQNPSWKLGFYRRIIERFAPSKQGGKLLDVGCGLGLFLASMREGGQWELSGTDLSEYAVEHNAGKWPDVTFKAASATDHPFEVDTFHVITALDVIEHVPDLEGVAAAVTVMLKPGGLFMFVVPVYDGITGPVIRVLDKDPTHVHKNARSFWTDWAGQHFEVLDWWGMMRYLLPGGLYMHIPTHVFRRHTPAILVAARKSGADSA